MESTHLAIKMEKDLNEFAGNDYAAHEFENIKIYY